MRHGPGAPLATRACWLLPAWLQMFRHLPQAATALATTMKAAHSHLVQFPHAHSGYDMALLVDDVSHTHESDTNCWCQPYKDCAALTHQHIL